MNTFPSECFHSGLEPDANRPIDVGEGWTLFINWARNIASENTNFDLDRPCQIEAFVKKVKGYKPSESPRATLEQLTCQRCHHIVDVSIFRADAIQR